VYEALCPLLAGERLVPVGLADTRREPIGARYTTWRLQLGTQVLLVLTCINIVCLFVRHLVVQMFLTFYNNVDQVFIVDWINVGNNPLLLTLIRSHITYHSVYFVCFILHPLTLTMIMISGQLLDC